MFLLWLSIDPPMLTSDCYWGNCMMSVCGNNSILKDTGNTISFNYSWWRHQMETFSALLALCAGNSPVTDEFPAQRPVTRSFDVFFDLRLNIRMSKQQGGWWFETPSRSLWRHCDVKLWYQETIQNTKPCAHWVIYMWTTPANKWFKQVVNTTLETIIRWFEPENMILITNAT